MKRSFPAFLPLFLILSGLLVLPVVAVYRQGWELQWTIAYVATLNLITYWTYIRDKRRAKEGLWRVPEQWMHLMELLGGWPAAFVAQQRVRHKCSKVSYQIVFWLIVLVYQFAAFDSLQHWKMLSGWLRMER